MWRIFRYNQGGRDRRNRRSVCGEDIEQYSQTIFRKEDREVVNIYSGAQIQLGWEVWGMVVEVRMRVEGMDGGTRLLLLEQIPKNRGWMVSRSGRALRVIDRERGFTVDFYNEEEAVEAYRTMAHSCQEVAARLRDLGVSEGRRSAPRVSVETVEEMVCKLNTWDS